MQYLPYDFYLFYSYCEFPLYDSLYVHFQIDSCDAELKETTLGFIFITMKRFQNLSIYIDLKKSDQILKSGNSIWISLPV